MISKEEERDRGVPRNENDGQKWQCLASSVKGTVFDGRLVRDLILRNVFVQSDEAWLWSLKTDVGQHKVQRSAGEEFSQGKCGGGVER